MLPTSKNSLSLTPELLGLSDIKVVNVRSSASGREIIIEVKSTKETIYHPAFREILMYPTFPLPK